MDQGELPGPRRRKSALSSTKRAAIITTLVILIDVIKTIALYIAQRPAALAGRLAAMLPRCSRRRDYSMPRRPQARDWWEVVVPHMRINDKRRFIRNFRVPPCVVDEIVQLAEQHPTFNISDHNHDHAVSVAKKVHMVLWRLGRPATVTDCHELFGVSEGFVDKWTEIVLHFIVSQFGHRLYKREFNSQSPM